MQNASMYQRYSEAFGVVMEALEEGGLKGSDKEAAEKFIALIAPSAEQHERRACPTSAAGPAEILRLLMSRQGLNSARELRGQPVASEALKGRRKLNTDQIRTLSIRFKISQRPSSPPP